MMDTQPESLVRRCPRLGNDVAFSYCRQSGENGLPCFQVFNCWWETFDVVTYLRHSIPDKDFQALVGNRPKPKITSLIELIEKIKGDKS